MTAYYNDLKLFFEKAATFPNQKVVLHVEPDFWGYMQQRATSDNATSVTRQGVGNRALRPPTPPAAPTGLRIVR
jgi:hypothetical protein